MAIKEIKNTFILDFEKQGFITILDKKTITGIHRFKTMVINGVELNDNLRLTTNKGFVIEILKKLGDTEFMYRLILEDQFKTSPVFGGNSPIGYHPNYFELEEFLNFISI